jgi:hypothetical protein
MGKPKNMSTCEIMQVLVDKGIAKTLSYDYETGRILRDGQEVEPKLEALHFIYTWNYKANLKDYQDALYYWARQNTPKPENVMSELHETISQYLANKNEVTTSELLSKCLKLSLTDKYRRRWEMQVAKVMKDLKWNKYRTSNKRVWVRKSLDLSKLPDDIL